MARNIGAAWHKQFKRQPVELRTGVDGFVYHSASECQRGNQLLLLQSQGIIRNLQRQVHFPLVIEGREVLTAKGKSCVHYVADFVYERQVNDGSYAQFAWGQIVEDHKGFIDPLASFKIRVFEAVYDYRVYIHKGGKNAPSPLLAHFNNLKVR